MKTQKKTQTTYDVQTKHQGKRYWLFDLNKRDAMEAVASAVANKAPVVVSCVRERPDDCWGGVDLKILWVYVNRPGRGWREASLPHLL